MCFSLASSSLEFLDIPINRYPAKATWITVSLALPPTRPLCIYFQNPPTSTSRQPQSTVTTPRASWRTYQDKLNSSIPPQTPCCNPSVTHVMYHFPRTYVLAPRNQHFAGRPLRKPSKQTNRNAPECSMHVPPSFRPVYPPLTPAHPCWLNPALP